MRKSFIVALLLVGAFIISVFLGYYISSLNKNSGINLVNESKLAEQNKKEENQVISTSSSENVISPNNQEDEVVDNNVHYILKEYNGCIAVYRMISEDEIVLEDVTDILTKYLSDEDLIELRDGISVIGLDELTHLLEDFE